MSTIFIIHGVGGNPQENWLATLKNYAADLTPETILIGHSLGGSFILNILEHTPVKAAYLVAPVFGILGNAFDEGMKTFAQHEFNWQAILANCPHFEIFHSDNDPYIKLTRAEELAQHLNTSVTLIPGGGHLNQSAGFTKFEELLERIQG